MTTITARTPRRVRTLADIIPGSRTRDAVLVLGFALLTAAAAQISIPLGFTPVPLTGQTFAVLLAGGVLGAARGSASQIVYVVLGATGLPFYADGEGGWTAATGSTAGYLVGFVLAAALVGHLAERGQDRHVVPAASAFLAGSVVIYTTGALWLAHDLGIPVAGDVGEPSAIGYGVAPFVVGDLLKAAVAALLLPATWALVTRFRSDD